MLNISPPEQEVLVLQSSSSYTAVASPSKDGIPVSSSLYDDYDEVEGKQSAHIQIENTTTDTIKAILVGRNIASPEEDEELVRVLKITQACIFNRMMKSDAEGFMEWSPVLQPYQSKTYRVYVDDSVSQPGASMLFIYTSSEVYTVRILVNGAGKSAFDSIRRPPRPSPYLFEEIGIEDEEVGMQDANEKSANVTEKGSNKIDLVTELPSSEATAELVQRLRCMLHSSQQQEDDKENGAQDLNLEKWTDIQKEVMSKHSRTPSVDSRKGDKAEPRSSTQNGQELHSETANILPPNSKIKNDVICEDFFRETEEEDDDVGDLGGIDMISREDNQSEDDIQAPETRGGEAKHGCESNHYENNNSSRACLHLPLEKAAGSKSASAASFLAVDSARPPAPGGLDEYQFSSRSSLGRPLSSRRDQRRPTSAASSPRRNDMSRQAARHIVQSLHEDTKDDEGEDDANYTPKHGKEALQTTGGSQEHDVRVQSLKPAEWSNTSQKKPSYKGSYVRGGPGISAVRALRQHSNNSKAISQLNKDPKCEGSFRRREWIQGDHEMGLDIEEKEPAIEILHPSSSS